MFCVASLATSLISIHPSDLSFVSNILTLINITRIFLKRMWNLDVCSTESRIMKISEITSWKKNWFTVFLGSNCLCNNLMNYSASTVLINACFNCYFEYILILLSLSLLFIDLSIERLIAPRFGGWATFASRHLWTELSDSFRVILTHCN